MKSKEEGMNTTVLALCTADFNTLGRSCALLWMRILVLRVEVRNNETYLCSKISKPLIRLLP